ncbi:enoyl-CoA hydratase-related protein [Roseibium sp.]|uniref:enoyl-CoA hydratase-related protein n=1 Tax=Roseibium sp. TaxID=1936156 RepID=UPI003515453E
MTELVELSRAGRVVIARLNRPEALNALNSALMTELTGKLARLDDDPDTGCFVLTGSEKAFAAGADIKDMQTMSSIDMLKSGYFSGWESFWRLKTPKVAAVSGFALGGGCELAMMCDTVYASENAKFGQPEIRLGVIPGMGGSQRLARLIGRVKAMDMILTGRTMDAGEALEAGLVARVFPQETFLDETIKTASEIANFSKIATGMAREAVNRADEISLSEGLLFERRVFHALFASKDQKEGMAAFTEKRKPEFKGE